MSTRQTFGWQGALATAFAVALILAIVLPITLTANNTNLSPCTVLPSLQTLLGTTPSTTATPLKILITNDDGWDETGIQKLQEKFLAAGHDARIYAPKGDASGSSNSLDLYRLVLLRTVQSTTPFQASVSSSCFGPFPGLPPGCSSVDELGPATPSACVVVGMTEFEPDLVVSGINDGNNIGELASVSGTVGGALSAVSTVLGGRTIPGIAISAAENTSPAILDEIATFTVHVVHQLQKNSATLLPRGTILNINYPKNTTSEIKAVKMARPASSVFNPANTSQTGALVYSPVLANEPAVGTLYLPSQVVGSVVEEPDKCADAYLVTFDSTITVSVLNIFGAPTDANEKLIYNLLL